MSASNMQTLFAFEVIVQSDCDNQRNHHEQQGDDENHNGISFLLI